MEIALVVTMVVTTVLVAVAVQSSPAPAQPTTVQAGTAPTAGPTSRPGTRSGLTKVAFLGDSYASGTGATSQSRQWATLVSADQKWDVKNLSQRSTGYSTAGDLGGKPYASRIGGIVATGAEVVVVSGGRMDTDVPSPKLRSDVRATLQGLHAGLSGATIIVVSPIWDYRPAPKSLSNVISVVKDEARRAGATYLDIGEPLLGHGDMVTLDGIFPNDAGHAAIAAAIEKALA